MSEQITILFLGFFLTTVGGTILGYFFQNRSWNYQNRVKLLESERATATEIFESISTLMDKRLYRMWLIEWSVREKTTEFESLEGHMKAYRQLLYEWNDTIIRNLALTEAYFGKKIRTQLGDIIYEEFRRIGSLLEKQYQARKSQSNVPEELSVDKDLRVLRSHMYELNFQMIAQIQKGEIGVFKKDKSV